MECMEKMLSTWIKDQNQYHVSIKHAVGSIQVSF